ncbi:MAG: hypothetical protein ACRDH2_14050, partial [Anaerolineales bacterium]
MTRPFCLACIVVLAFGVAGCIVVVPAPTLTPAPPPLITSTLPPVITLVPSPTPISILPTALPTFTPVSSQSEFSSATPIPAQTTATPPFASTPTSTTVPLSIVRFAIAPPEIQPGEAVTLTWEVVAQQTTLWQLDALGRLSISYTVPISGSLVITTPGALRNRVDFVLFASSGASWAQAGVSARLTCPDVWFFPNPPASCPGSPPHDTVMQAEHFERGLMLWTQWDDSIYILYADGRSPHWNRLGNVWFPGMPESDPNIVPPAGFYQPVRGFGLAWREGYVSPVEVVRDRLGWATDEEFGVSEAAIQCDSAPKYSTCYLTGPGGVVYVLQPEFSGWAVWNGP